MGVPNTSKLVFRNNKKCTINISFYWGRFMFIAVLILPIIVCLPVLINYIVCLLQHSDIYDPK